MGALRRHRTDLLLAAAVLCLVAPVVQELMAYQAPRLAMTAAVWDRHTIRIDDYEHILGVDWAERDGHLYSHQAPGQQVLAVPAYAAYRALGGEPADRKRIDGNLGLWAVSFATSAVPAAGLAVLMRRLALRVAPDPTATAAALGLAFGTLLLPLSTVLFGHVLAGLLVTGAAMLLLRDEPSGRAVAAAGALAGFAVSVEYTMAAVVVVLTVLAAVRARRRLGWWVLGGAGPALLLGAYHWAAFGHPLSTSYDHLWGEGSVTVAGGARWPSAVRLADVLLGERGLFLSTPIVLLAVAGAVVLVRSGRGPARAAAAVGLASFTALVLVQSGWPNSTGGDSPGARYVAPALPLLAAGLAVAARRWPVLVRGLGGFSVGVMVLASVTHPLMARDAPNALYGWVRLAGLGRWSETLPGLVVGDAGVAVVVAGAAALGAACLRSAGVRGPGAVARPPAVERVPAAAAATTG